MSHTPRRLRPRRQPKGIPVIFRSKTRPVITEQEARVIRARYEDARRGMPLVVSSDIEIIGRCVMTDEDYLTHGQPDSWREGYNQALREVRDTLMDGNHE